MLEEDDIATLTEADERLLARLEREQRWAVVGGIVLTLLAAAYLGWAITSFDPRGDPRGTPAYDGPIARIGFLYDGYQQRLDREVPRDGREQLLMEGLRSQMSFSAGMFVLATRILLGTLAAMAGLAALTVAMERHRLLRIIARLRAPGGDSPAPH